MIEEARRRSHVEPVPARRRWRATALLWAGTRLKKILVTALVLGLLYVAMREFGGPEFNRYFDRFVARLSQTVAELFTGRR